MLPFNVHASAVCWRLYVVDATPTAVPPTVNIAGIVQCWSQHRRNRKHGHRADSSYYDSSGSCALNEGTPDNIRCGLRFEEKLQLKTVLPVQFVNCS